MHVNSMRNSLLSVVESLHGRIIKKKKTKQTWEYTRNLYGRTIEERVVTCRGGQKIDE